MDSVIQKKAIFKKLGYIERSNRKFDRNIEDVVDISKKIPKEALIQLRDFILEQRKQEDSTFCNTIYTAVEAELQRKQQQNNQ